MVNIPLEKIWLYVKPTIGLPLFFSGVAIVSLLIHGAVMINTSWYPAFYNGKAKPRVAEVAPAPTAPALPALASLASR